MDKKKRVLTFSTPGAHPINAWFYIKGKLTEHFQDLVKAGHRNFQVTIEALDD